MIKCIVLLFSAVLILSCTSGISEEEAVQQFEQALIGKQFCQTDENCTIISPGCPLGCNVSVNTIYSTELQMIGADLVEQFNSGGKGCDYGCVVAYPVCVIDRCESRN